MAQKLDRSYFGTSTRSTANHTTEQRKEETPSAGGTAQKLDRSYFNKPKSAPATGAASQARNVAKATNAGKNKPSAQKKSFFEIATQNKAPGRVAGNA